MNQKHDLSAVDQLILDATQQRQSRRQILKRALALGLSAPAISMLLAACAEDDGDDSTDAEDDDEEAAADSDTDDDEDPDTSDDESEDTDEDDTSDDGDGDMASEEELVIAMSVEPDTLENWKAYSTDGHPVLRNVQEALLNRDPETNELVGELATDWEQVDDSTWRFHLREGVTFHNGDPLNAEVVAFGLNYTWSPDNNFEIYQFVGPDINAEAVDEYTVDVTTESPDPILPSRLYFSPIPNMNQVEERPDSLPTEPIGTGPYRFVEWEQGQHILLEMNEDWWGHDADDSGGDVTIPRVRFVFRPESSVRASMVSAGEAHIGRFLSPEDCETTPQCTESSSLEVIFLRPDTMHPAMSDIRVREAIALAVDKQAVADEFFGGGQPASQLISEAVTGYNPDLEPYPYDMERAQELVQEAADDGVDIEAPITVVSRDGIYLRHDEFAEYVANQLNEAGLNVSSQVIEPAQYNPDYSTSYADVPEDRGWIATNPHGNEIMDLSTTASSYYRCEGGASTYCNEEVDAQYEEALPLTGEEREEAFHELTRLVYEDYGMVPIITMPLFYGLSENLNWTPRLDAFMLLKEMSFS